MIPPWVLSRRAGTAAELHGEWPTDPDRRALAICRVTGGPALVLGSTQRADAVVAGDVDVVRRRSGGGAVLVAQDSQVWVEAWVPRQDPLWDDDIVRGAHWFGALWAGALSRCGARSPVVHAGRADKTAWSGVICFAGMGPGEVAVGGRKVVGLSQRRTRFGARLHSMALVSWDPVALVSHLAMDDADRARAIADTRGAATGLDAVCDGGPGEAGSLIAAVEDALLDELADGE